MISEIDRQHSQLKQGECVRVITVKDGWELCIDKTDIIKETDSGMLRIIRADGRLTAINTALIVMSCISRKW